MAPFGYLKSQVDSALKRLARREADGSPGTLVTVPMARPVMVHPYPAVPGYKGSLVFYTVNPLSPFGRSL